MTEQTASLLMMCVPVSLLILDWRQTITIVKEGRSEMNGALKWLWKNFDYKYKKKLTDAYFAIAIAFWPVLYVLFWPDNSFTLAVLIAICYPWEVWCVMNNIKLKIKPAGF